ncbi:FecR domain-containing protein, partial [Candidatus Uhrbacteria bacterium]|nr:FecR domain-containing protein [Candidatus Uhrbacteria bacterium]
MKYSRLLSSLAVIVVFGALVWGGAWFWSVGSVAAEYLPGIRIQVKSGTVELRKASETAFQTVQDVMEIQPGDTVKTGTASEAEILWGDLGVSRVAENSEVVIDDAPRDVSGEGAVIRLKVNAGRVWNRMLKLLDLESSMQVQTSDVVATVRGTSYGIIKQPNCTEAAVTESVVGISADGSGSEVLLADNEWGSFGANDCKAPVRKLTPADEWPAQERLKDERFDRDYLAGLRSRFEARAEPIKNTPNWIVDTSEKLHLALAT